MRRAMAGAKAAYRKASNRVRHGARKKLTVHHVRKKADAIGKDVFLLDNGDAVDGTGLSSTEVDGSEVFPLLEALPLDALNCGNHGGPCPRARS